MRCVKRSARHGSGEVCMATRKRTTSRRGIVDRAVRAGRQALREAEKRVPPDLRRQVERRIKDADKTARAAIKQLQAQAKKASTRADVNARSEERRVGKE